MRKQPKQYTPQEKVAILRGHLIEIVRLLEMGEEYDGLKPTVYYRRQKQFFEQGATVFQRCRNSEVLGLKRRSPPLLPTGQSHVYLCFDAHHRQRELRGVGQYLRW